MLSSMLRSNCQYFEGSDLRFIGFSDGIEFTGHKIRLPNFAGVIFEYH